MPISAAASRASRRVSRGGVGAEARRHARARAPRRRRRPCRASARASSTRASRSSPTTEPATSIPISPSSAFATAPAATITAVCRALARSSASRTSASPYLSTPARSAWPGRGSVTASLPLPVRLALGRPRAHPPRPVLVVAVPDDERERRAERAPVAEAGVDLDLVGLDLLARAAAVALLAAAEVGVDRGLVERQARRQAADDRDQRRPVRLAGGDELETHAAKPTAARITSTGAGIPVQSSNDAAPWATSTSRPVITVAPAVARGPRRRRLRVRQVDQRLPLRERAEDVVALGRGVDDAGRRPPRRAASRPVARRPRASGERGAKRGGRAARAEDHRPLEPEAGRGSPCPSSDPRCARRGRRACSPSRDRCPTAAAAAALCGASRSRPRSRARRARAPPSSTRPSSTSSGTYAQSSPRAANAAFCIAGESECSTGLPISPTSWVRPLIIRTLIIHTMRGLVGLELVEAGREEVAAAVRLARRSRGSRPSPGARPPASTRGPGFAIGVGGSPRWSRVLYGESGCGDPSSSATRCAGTPSP